MNRDNFLIRLLNGSVDDVSFSDTPINPFNQKSVNITSNKNPRFVDNPLIKNYIWSLREFNFDENIQFPLLRPDLLNSTNYINPSLITSDNGNLSINNVQEKNLQIYSANMFCRQSKTTTLNINWDDCIAIYLNDSLITSNYLNSGYSSVYRDIYLASGNNNLDIYLYSYSGNKSFNLNTDLGLVVDGWQVPGFVLPDVPENITITNDINSNLKKDPNFNIVEWDKEKTDSYSSTLGYKIYRLGPYNSGLPQISNATITGYELSYLTGYNPFNEKNIYYSISSLNENGESLPTECLLAVPTGLINPPLLTGYQLRSVPSSPLSGVNWEYAALCRVNNKYIFTQPINVAADNDIVDLQYKIGNNYDYIDIFRISGYNDSGVKLVRNDIKFFYSYLVATITGLGTGVFTDYGNQSPIYQSGMNILFGSNDEYARPSFYKENTFRLSWGQITGATSYNIYKTNYSGFFINKSLIGTTTDTYFVDSGVYTIGKPISYENIGSVDYNKRFNDSVISNRTYSYKISAYNYSYIESLSSSGYLITAGDPFPPDTPSGVTITSFNGFATLGWQNGIEPDLEGTIIYQSQDDLTYNEIARTTSNTYSTFIGYSGSPYFKLANYDTSDNISVLTSAYRASGTLIADNIILKYISILSTADIDLDYYLNSGYLGGTSNPYRTRISAPISNIGGINGLYYCSSLNESSNNQFNFHKVDPDGTLTKYTLDSIPDRISGVDSLVVSRNAIPTTSSRLFVTYYTGVDSSSNNFLHYRVYNKGAGSTYNVLTTSTTGINIGKFYNTYVNGLTTKGESRPYPTIISRSGFVDYSTIVFVSGDSYGVSAAIGFYAIGYNGTPSGIPKYMSLHAGNLSSNAKISAAYDSSGYIHLIFDSYIGVGNSSICYYKVNFNPLGNSPVEIISSGKYTRGGGTYGAYVYDSNFVPKFSLENPQMICDKNDELSIFYRQYGGTSRFLQYSKLDTNGNALLLPNILYQMPFNFTEDFSIGYNIQDDTIYSSYDMSIQPDQSRRLVYNYLEGAYRRRHEFERFSDSSMYQILQSISK